MIALWRLPPWRLCGQNLQRVINIVLCQKLRLCDHFPDSVQVLDRHLPGVINLSVLEPLAERSDGHPFYRKALNDALEAKERCRVVRHFDYLIS
jgi:hypothetical protein